MLGRKDGLLSLLETSNKVAARGKAARTNQCASSSLPDFLVIRAQLPLRIDPASSYIPDPLFVYANMNEMRVELFEELLGWLSYKPVRGDDDLLNLLVMELFDDDSADQADAGPADGEAAAAAAASSAVGKKIKMMHDPRSQASSTMGLSSSHQLHSMTTTRSVGSAGSTRSSVYGRSHDATSHQHHHQQQYMQQQRARKMSTMSNSEQSNAMRPSIVDTYYDLLKSLHVQLCLCPCTIVFKSLSRGSAAQPSSEQVVVELPCIDLKSAGTK